MTSGEFFTFRVEDGEHQGAKRRYKKGDVFRTREPLDKMFVGKFTLVPNTTYVPDDSETDERAVPPALQERRFQVPTGQVKDMMPFSFSEASNVSHLFPLAEKSGLSVYKDSLGGFAVAIAGAQVKTNIAKVVLGSKKKVQEFLEDYIGPTDSFTQPINQSGASLEAMSSPFDKKQTASQEQEDADDVDPQMLLEFAEFLKQKMERQMSASKAAEEPTVSEEAEAPVAPQAEEEQIEQKPRKKRASKEKPE